MATENKRGDFQKQLKGRVAEYIEQYPHDHGTSDFPSADELYDELIRPIVLESFKNGLAQGKRKRTAPNTDGRGSALQNGKLRRKA